MPSGDGVTLAGFVYEALTLIDYGLQLDKEFNLTFRASGLELFLILSASFFQCEVQKSLSDISRYSSMVL